MAEKAKNEIVNVTIICDVILKVYGKRAITFAPNTTKKRVKKAGKYFSPFFEPTCSQTVVRTNP